MNSELINPCYGGFGRKDEEDDWFLITDIYAADVSLVEIPCTNRFEFGEESFAEISGFKRSCIEMIG